MSRLRDTLNAARDRAEEAADSARDTGRSVRDGAADLADPNESADWVPGVEEARESEQFQRRQEEYQDAEGFLGRFDAATAAGSDFILDNPGGSVQDTTRSGIERLTGLDSEEQAEAAQDVDEGVTESIDSAVEGTAFDNRGTDAVRTGGDILFGELVRTGVGASTGIDTREGDTEARTGALELADIGLTVGTAGAGRAGVAAARSTDDVGGLLGRVLGRGGDDASSGLPAVRGTDDLARAGDDAGSAAARGADESLPAVRGTDDVARSADDAGSAAARGADDDTIRMTAGEDGVFSMAARSADDAGSTAARSGDNLAGGLAGRIGDSIRNFRGAAARSADEATGAATRAGDSLGDVIRGATRSADDAASRLARAGDDATGAIRAGGSRAGSAARAAPGRAGRAARNRPLATAGVAGAGALVAGGAAHQQLFGGADEVELEDEDGNTFYIHRSGSFEPTEERPDGGVLWRVEQNGSTQGYSVVLSVEGDTVTLLDGDGGEMASTLAAVEYQQAAARAEERRRTGGQK